MRLTDEQVGYFQKLLWGELPSVAGDFRAGVRLLLADREALVAENEKLRRVVEAAKALEFKPYPAHGSGFIMAVVGPPNGNTELSDALAALEPKEASDAQDKADD